MPSMWVRDQAYIKRRNMQTVLTLLMEHQPLSRAEIARITAMSPASVTRMVGALLARGLVSEAPEAKPQGRGRKAISLRVDKDGMYTLGVSLRPGHIGLGLLDFGNNLLYRAERTLSAAGPQDPAALAWAVRGMTREMPPEFLARMPGIKAVGVCIAGIIDYEGGTVLQSDQMQWKGVDVAAPFASVLGLPVYAENDVKACLTSEKARGGLKEEDVAYLLIGSSVGIAAMAQGKVLRGSGNATGEVIRLPAVGGGTLGDHLVTSRLVERAQAVEPQAHSMEDIVRARRLEIGWARMLMGDVNRCLLSTLEIIKGLYNPQVYIIGGSLYPHVADTLRASPFSRHIRVGEAYGTACIAGAAIVAQQRAIEALISQELDAI